MDPFTDAPAAAVAARRNSPDADDSLAAALQNVDLEASDSLAEALQNTPPVLLAMDGVVELPAATDGTLTQAVAVAEEVQNSPEYKAAVRKANLAAAKAGEVAVAKAQEAVRKIEAVAVE